MNAQDTNLTIHYNRIQRIREIVKLNVTISYRRKQEMCEILTQLFIIEENR